MPSVAFDYRKGQTSVTGAGRRVTDLPGGPCNHHWTKNILASPDGRHLYATVGSNSNVAENGIDEEQGRAAIWQIDLQTGAKRLFATGLRNPNGLAWEPQTGVLWTVVNERDELGNDLVPDYLTSVRDGGFYGWPYSYFGQHVDQAGEACQDAGSRWRSALAPDYALGAHVAALGLATGCHGAAARLAQRHVHRRARLLEPQAPGRLPGGVRAIRRRQAQWPAAARADRLRERKG